MKLKYSNIALFLFVACCFFVTTYTQAKADKKIDIAFGSVINPKEQVKSSKILAKTLINPDSPNWRSRGDNKKFYRFPDSGTDVPYRVCVPDKWDGKSKLPMVVFLHGGWNDESSYLDQNEKQMVKLANEFDFLLVSPLGYKGAYGNSLLLPAVFGKPEAAKLVLSNRNAQRDSNNILSEKDVINVIELVIREYPVDIKNVFLTGHSMGSGGTWYLGAKYYKYWNSLAPMSGPFVQESEYPWARMRKIPVFMSEGIKATASLEGSRLMANWMKENGFPIEYKEVNADHGGMVPLILPEVFAFFRSQIKK